MQKTNEQELIEIYEQLTPENKKRAWLKYLELLEEQEAESEE